MKYEEFKKELHRQIGINAKYFEPAEVQTLYDLEETIAKEDFE